MVEFVGLPGAGKSTLAAKVVEELRGRGSPCGDRSGVGERHVSRLAHHARQATFFLRRPGPLLGAARAALGGGPAANRLAHAVRVAAWAYRFDRARARRESIVLLDQGIVQEAWSTLMRGSGDDDRVHRLLGGILRGSRLRHAFVLVEVEVSLALDRIGGRGEAGRSSVDRMDRSAAGRHLAAGQERLRDLYGQALRSSGSSGLTIDGSAPVATNCMRVLAFVEATAGSRT